MKLSIYNGSPRGISSNSEIFADLLTEGFAGNAEISRHYIKDVSKHDEIINDTADCYFIVFPLYADLAPFGVKAFFENMEGRKSVYRGKPIYFFIHSGFPEAKQSRLLERYLRYFCSIIEADCKSICIMGNSEGVRRIDKESKKYAKLKQHMVSFAQDITSNKPFNEEGIRYFHVMETMPKPALFIFKHFPALVNMGFDIRIKNAGVYDKRFDKPYA